MYKNIALKLGKIFSSRNERSVLFIRNFISFQGGHLKVWNYYQYLKKIPGFSPKIYFTDNSVWDRNPWKDNCIPEKEWNPNAADILFLAGVDWARMEGFDLDEKVPIINLIQGLRHADPEDRRFQYLSRKAIRICVSEEVSDALKKTGQVNGPIFTIPNGIDLELIKRLVAFPSRNTVLKPIDVLISGLKNESLAKELESRLKQKGLIVEALYNGIPRELYLKKLADAKVSLLLPRVKEGFYLPALESMALGAITICPDCIGNRSFSNDQINCFIANYNADSLEEKALSAMAMNTFDYEQMVKHGISTSKRYSLNNEEYSFIKIIKNLDHIWSATSNKVGT